MSTTHADCDINLNTFVSVELTNSLNSGFTAPILTVISHNPPIALCARFVYRAFMFICFLIPAKSD